MRRRGDLGEGRAVEEHGRQRRRHGQQRHQPPLGRRGRHLLSAVVRSASVGVRALATGVGGRMNESRRYSIPVGPRLILSWWTKRRGASWLCHVPGPWGTHPTGWNLFRDGLDTLRFLLVLFTLIKKLEIRVASRLVGWPDSTNANTTTSTFQHGDVDELSGRRQETAAVPFPADYVLHLLDLVAHRL
jgi:hypothetical protein